MPLAGADRAPCQASEHRLKTPPFQLQLCTVLTDLSSTEPAPWLPPSPQRAAHTPQQSHLGVTLLGTEPLLGTDPSQSA